MPRHDLVRARGGTAAEWSLHNPVLANRELGVETDTGKLKFGDGLTAWGSLSYVSGGSTAWNSIPGKPTVIGAGADAAAARTAIGAGKDTTPEFYGAVGDATANDTAAFTTTFTNAIAAVLRNAYRIDNLQVTNKELRGDHINVLRAVGANPILRLRTGSVLDSITIDGESSTSRRVDVGNTGDTNISARNVVLVDCPSNSFRAIADTSVVRLVNIYANNSKVFNTDDLSTARSLLFTGIICVNSPTEAFLLDFPGSTPTWTGFSMGSSVWELSANSKRAIGLARAVGGVISGQVIRGHLSTNNPTDSDLIHVEDKAQTIAVVGNVMETNGQSHAIDGALGGDPTYTQTDRNPKELLYTSNLYKATDSNTTFIMYLEGTAPAVFERVTIAGETMLCNGVAKPLQILAKSGIYGGNYLYDATATEYVRTGDVPGGQANHSAQGANIIRLPSYHVTPQFLRTSPGHGYNPQEVLFRSSFGFDTQTNFQTWASSIKTLTGATIFVSGGSVGTGGTITFPVDSTTGAIYMRATRGSVAMTTRFDFTWSVHDIDFQNLDTLAVRLQTRSSVQNAGKIDLQLPSAGPSSYARVLNDGADFASWKVDGGSKMTPSSANFYAASAGTIKVSFYPGDSLATAGDTADYALFAIGINRSTPF